MLPSLLAVVTTFLFLLSTTSYAALNPGQSELTGNKVGTARALAKGEKAPAGKAVEKYRQGVVLVKFKSGTTGKEREAFHQRNGTRKEREYARLRLERVRVKPGETVKEAVGRLQKDPAVEYAEPDYIQTIQATPIDPSFIEQWALSNTGQTGGTSGADIKAEAAWDLTTGSSQAVVAVIDTGIDYNHPDLAANMWVNPGEIAGNGLDDDGNGYIDDIHGYNAITNSGDPIDDYGHGTHVAGTIGAVGNNSLGVTGVNWMVRIIGCKFLGADGSGSTSDAIECLEYVRAVHDQGVPIVATNNSWGGSDYSQALYDAINAQRDILLVAAAGNKWHR